ncbi:MAG TPA: hypothetical protein DCQ06_06030, partial [Myxococcales bacterium]|nr:hypothetical protein [Myxococcales bacterium]
MRAMSRYFSSLLVVSFTTSTLLFAGCGEAPVDDEQSSDTVSQGETSGSEDTSVVDDTSTGQDTTSADSSNFDTTASDSSTEQDASSPDAAPTCPGAPGCECKEDSECSSGPCVLGADGKSSCAVPCDDKDTCENGVCTDLASAKFCVDPFVATCSPCLTNAHCDVPGATDGACVDRGATGSFCSTACAVDGDCAEGYACVDSKDVAGKEAKRCLPNQDAECTCNGWAKLKALTTSCYADGLPGCEATRSCEDKGLSACEPATPQAETCDGVDQDCDGTADNGSLCDDGNPCTQDACGGPAGCTVTNDDSANCDDGDACTKDDKCESGACVGPAVQCDDNNVCTDDSCDKAKGCVNLANKVTCDDADACTENEMCSGGSCVGSKVGCDDNNICTDDSCDPAKGCANLPNTVTCTDGDACTIDTCKDTKCISTAKNCDDGNICTTEFCEKSKGCQFLKNALPCTDGDACTSDDTCKDGQCSLSNPKNCDDNNACTTDSCDKKTGTCSNTAVKDGEKCDDGNDCTLNDACDKGSCKGKDKTCDDGNPCTLDVCVAGTGCDAVEVGCDDDNICTTEPELCDPKVGCGLPKAVSPCNQNKVKFPYQVGFKCGSEASQAWTLSKGALGPVWAVDKTPAKPQSEVFDCSLNFNNGTDFNCQPGGAKVEGTATSPEIAIVGALSPALTFNYAGDWESNTYDDLVVEVVDVVSKQATQLATLNGSATWKPMSYDLKAFIGKTIQIRFTFKTTDCVQNDGIGPFIDALSVSDVHCSFAGCDDGDACTKGVCDVQTGKCTNSPNLGAPCDDGNPCSNSFCDKDGKCAGTPWVGKACDDGNECTKDSCDDKGACVGTPLLGATCDDGNECTMKDACDKDAKCQGSVSGGKSCDDGQVCTGPDKCDLSAKCVGAPAKGKACDDEDACTSSDVCDEKAQCAGVTKCDDGNACTNDSCDPVNGFCKFATNTDLCSDGNACSLGDKCKDGICFAGDKTNCDDGNACTADLCDTKSGLCTHNVIQGCKITCKSDSDCADTDLCTANTCDVKTGSCNIAPAKDGTVCGVGSTCLKGGCAPVNPVDGWAVKLSAYSNGNFHCALLKNKSVACWGRNNYGQLGDGTNLTSGKPVAVKDLKNIIDISAGYQHACAVDQQGKIYCWGYNSSYQLGEGTTTSSKVPVTAAKGITDAIAVSAGYNHTCALRKDKTVVCWGNNSDGQSGGSDSGTIAKIEGMSNVVSIFTALNLSCAIRSDGSKWCWGRNDNLIAKAPETFSFSSPVRDSRTSKWSSAFVGNRT